MPCLWPRISTFAACGWLYEIPAVVIHGDTLAMKEWSRWYTPFVTYVEPPVVCEQFTCDMPEVKVG